MRAAPGEAFSAVTGAGVLGTFDAAGAAATVQAVLSGTRTIQDGHRLGVVTGAFFQDSIASIVVYLK